MMLVKSTTELTTSATDVVLAIECVVIMIGLWKAEFAARWRVRLWGWVFGLLAISSLLGAWAHGVEMPEAIRAVLWMPLYLCLGILMALFLIGAIADGWGWAAARPLLPWGVGVGIAFFAVTQLLDGTFFVFIVYEVLVLIGALGLYTFLAATQRLQGAGVVALAILLHLAAAAVQASQGSLHVFLPFDHNGVFHLLQIVSTAVLWLGLALGMKQSLHQDGWGRRSR